jgi:hypothetical protein
MRDTGEAIMNMFATNAAHRPSRIGGVVIVSGAMLGAVGPAFSADLPYDYPPPYRPTYYQDSYTNYNTGYAGCYSYSCTCCAQRPVAAPLPVEQYPPVPVVERPAVAERHWVQRDYIERQYPSYPAATRYAYSSYPGPYRYTHYCQGPCVEPYPAYEHAPHGEPRRHFSYVGAYHPPAPAPYEYEHEPYAPYRYAASSHRPRDYDRPAYEYDYKPAYEYKPTYEYKPAYEHEPRPPAAVRGGYYGPGYSE